MRNGTRRKLAVVCYALGTAGLAASFGVGLGLIKLRDQLLEERESMLRGMEDWKAETQAEMFQTIADQQARGLLDFREELARQPLRAVPPLPDDDEGEEPAGRGVGA